MPATLRRLPVPSSLPPYDDEIVDRIPVAPTQGTLALQFQLPNRLPAVPTPPRLAVVHDDVTTDEAERWAAPRPTSASELPDPRAWAARLAQAVLEIAAGGRPAAQLLRWTTLEVYDELQTAARRAGLRGCAVRSRTAPPQLTSLRMCCPADGIAEVSAVAADGTRRRAIALRLEGRDGRWQCTALQLG